MLLVSIFLVVVPLWQSAIPQLIAFGGILLGIPMYVFFVMHRPWRVKPKVVDWISGKSLFKKLCNYRVILFFKCITQRD